MKYNSILVIIFVLYCCLALGGGCKEDRSGITAIDGYFEIINAVIKTSTDIDLDHIESMHQIYKAYERTKEKGFVNEKMYIMCAIDITDILLTADMSPKDLKNIEAARVALYALLLDYP